MRQLQNGVVFGVFRGLWPNSRSSVPQKWLSLCRGIIRSLCASGFDSYCYTRQDTVPKVVLYSVLWGIVWTTATEARATLSPENTTVDSCAPHKISWWYSSIIELCFRCLNLYAIAPTLASVEPHLSG